MKTKENKPVLNLAITLKALQMYALALHQDSVQTLSCTLTPPSISDIDVDSGWKAQVTLVSNLLSAEE